MNSHSLADDPFRIAPARSRDELDAAKRLFAKYAASLPIDLGYQSFPSELAELPGKYAPPKGELLVAWDKLDRPLGCVGLRPFDHGSRCEMKRLYVTPRARSFGLGKALATMIVKVASDLGYSELLLDTLPTMEAAARLYERMGFRRVRPYYAPTPKGTIFMSLDLKGGQVSD